MSTLRPRRTTLKTAAKNTQIIDISSDDEPPNSSKYLISSDSEFDQPIQVKTKRKFPVKTIPAEKPPEKKRKKENNNANNDFETNIDNVIDRESSVENYGFHNKSAPWTIDQLLAERQCISLNISQNIVNLFKNDNTIPFICRYRRDLIGPEITPEKLRYIKNTYSEILNLQKRSETIINQLQKENNLNPNNRNDFLAARTIEELEFLYAPYKPANKGTHAERAKALGLEKYAKEILDGNSPPVQLNDIVDYSNEKLDNVEKVKDGIMHLLSHIMSKNSEILEELRRLQKVHRIQLKSSRTSSKTKSTSKKNNEGANNKNNDDHKYELYFNFECLIRYIKPHQILAINRGEKLKHLIVKIIVPDQVKLDLMYCCRRVYLSHGVHYGLRTELFQISFEDCYSKKLQPLLSRQIRSDLNEIAKTAAIEVFARNLKQLLLMSPLKGEKILGIDPGFSNGCKLALISESSDLLEYNVIYPHTRTANLDLCTKILVDLLNKHSCKIIALGNGTACRETEFWITKLFDEGVLDPDIIRYSIVSENGASVYSCSDTAKKEFPKLDINIISAVSIARRLNDPLSELVKIDPKNIGVGMYQHDINEKILTESLNEVVSECVSFVGVDINTASISILKHIAGLTESRAEKIIQYRIENGSFKTRKDLLKVKTIGEKTFTQCAGFVRIEPKTVTGEIRNILDTTNVHPESYYIAEKIIKSCKLNMVDIGQREFINEIKKYVSINRIEQLSKDFKIPKERVDVVLETLQIEINRDYREDFNKRPLFKKGIFKMSDLKRNFSVTGAVSNITHFGAFVDIGCENDGLIHTSNMNGMILNIGDRVNVQVIDIEINRRRIQLKLESMGI